jgi:hypothetical protein
MTVSHARGAARAGRGSRGGALVPTVGLGCSALLAWGFSVRHEAYVVAEFGAGYALGFLGTSMMLLLLFYSLRKRLPLLRGWGRAPAWLDAHMVLGLLAPTAILFHANFQLGSLNSRVALVCLLVVAASGVVGRLIYPKIHSGLSGRRADVRELRQAAQERRAALGLAQGSGGGVGAELAALEALALAGGNGALAASGRLLRLRRRARRFGRGGAGELPLRTYVDALVRVAEFRAYERLFGLWHAFHLPFCVMLFSAAAVHVVAVHLY